jgi:hypothetical protein
LQNITNIKLKVIYCDRTNEFVGPNYKLIKKAKTRGIEVILLITRIFEQNHVAKQSHLV